MPQIKTMDASRIRRAKFEQLLSRTGSTGATCSSVPSCAACAHGRAGAVLMGRHSPVAASQAPDLTSKATAKGRISNMIEGFRQAPPRSKLDRERMRAARSSTFSSLHKQPPTQTTMYVKPKAPRSTAQAVHKSAAPPWTQQLAQENTHPQHPGRTDLSSAQYSNSTRKQADAPTAYTQPLHEVNREPAYQVWVASSHCIQSAELHL